MTYLGTVRDGVVVLPVGVELPEGAAVRIEPVESPTSDSTGGSIWNLSDLAIDAGAPDLAENLDHYLYGHPKATDDA